MLHTAAGVPLVRVFKRRDCQLFKTVRRTDPEEDPYTLFVSDAALPQELEELGGRNADGRTGFTHTAH